MAVLNQFIALFTNRHAVEPLDFVFLVNLVELVRLVDHHHRVGRLVNKDAF